MKPCILLAQEMSEQAKSVLHNTSIYILLKEKLRDPKGKVSLTTEEWIVIEDTLRDVYQAFFEKLNDIYSFNQYELRVCILIKYVFFRRLGQLYPFIIKRLRTSVHSVQSS